MTSSRMPCWGGYYTEGVGFLVRSLQVVGQSFSFIYGLARFPSGYSVSLFYPAFF